MNPIVIIGTGLAGYNLAKEIRKLDKSAGLVLLTADAGESYSKPMLSNALSKGKAPAQLVLSSAQQMAETLHAQVITQTRVLTIDPLAHKLHTTTGEFAYAKLILAIGAQPIGPKLSGSGAADVLSVNNLDDYQQFHRRLNDAQHISIIGPGLIGCEFANDLINVGKSVTVVGPSIIPLDRLLPEPVGEYVKQVLEKAGIHFQLGARAIGIDKDNAKFELHLSNSSTITTDLVLSAIGLQPSTTLAQAAGLTVNKGIVVDRLLQTSNKDIYALGDCMEVEGLVLPFVLPIMHAARSLAKTLTGNPTPLYYPAMPVVIKTPAHPMVVATPAAGNAGKWNINIDTLGARALCYGTDGELLGFALTGDKLNEKQTLTQQLPDTLH